MKDFLSKIWKGLKWFFKSFLWIIPLGILLDQISKIIIFTYKPVGLVFIPYIFNFEYCVNDGAAWSMLSGKQWLLAVISIVGAGVMIGYLSWKYKKIKLSHRICLSLMIAGTMGNMIDRIFVFVPGTIYNDAGGVVDFIEFAFWPSFGAIFNIADSLLVVGVILLFVLMIVEEVIILVYKQKVEDRRNLIKEALEKEENADRKKVYYQLIEEINQAVAADEKEPIVNVINKIDKELGISKDDKEQK